MNRRRELRSSLRLLGAWSLALLIASSAMADYRSSYSRGRAAVDREQWAEAARFLEEAIGDRPQAGGRVNLYGTRYETYLPYFYLGLARYSLGDFEGAARAFDTAKEQGAIRGTPQATQMAEMRSTIAASQPRGPSPELRQALEESARELAATRDARSALDRKLGDSEVRSMLADRADLGQSVASLDAQLTDVEAAIDTAREADDLAALRAAVERLVEIRSRITSSGQEIDQAIETARLAASEREQQANAAARRQKALVAVQTLVTRARALRERRPDASPAALASLDRVLARAERSGSSTPLGDLEVMRSDLAAAIEALESGPAPDGGTEGVPEATPPLSSPGPAPARLVAAARALFTANYQEALATLGNERFGEARADLQANLFRAAASFALYLTGGQVDEARLEAARESIRSCRRLDPTFRPEKLTFSPRFRKLFETTGG